ncbi:MAG: flagellar protein FliS [bacterium]|jgi:flagellar protein FliS
MNPYQTSNNAYKQASVTTRDQASLIIMLYDGAIKFVKQAKLKIKANDIEGIHVALTRAKDIISELSSSLNMETNGNISQNLRSLYDYIYSKLIDANVRKDDAGLDEVVGLLSELREGWNAISDQSQNTTMESTKKASLVKKKPLNIRG